MSTGVSIWAWPSDAKVLAQVPIPTPAAKAAAVAKSVEFVSATFSPAVGSTGDVSSVRATVGSAASATTLKASSSGNSGKFNSEDVCVADGSTSAATPLDSGKGNSSTGAVSSVEVILSSQFNSAWSSSSA